MEPLADLKEKIAARRILVVAGTGVSMGCAGHACCTWAGLLDHGLKQAQDVGDPSVRLEGVDDDIGSGDTDRLIFAAKKIAKALGGPRDGRFKAWLRASVGGLRISDAGHSLADALVALGAPLATTNYDGLLTEASGRRPVTWRQHHLVKRFLDGDESAVLHLHGH